MLERFLSDTCDIHRDVLPYGARDSAESADETFTASGVACRLQAARDDVQRMSATDVETEISEWTLHIPSETNIRVGDLVEVSRGGETVLTDADVVAVDRLAGIWTQYLWRARLRRIGAE